MNTCVIIGAGLGGLFTGAILAKEGLHVTVLEKNATIGGGLQSFRRFGEVFDTGMHVIGGMHPGGNIRRICEYLGVYDDALFDHVHAEHATHLYVAEDGATYDISEGRDGFIESLSHYFPHQRENLVRYVDAMFRLADEVPLYYLRPTSTELPVHSDEFFMPADAFIASYITDPKLRSVVAYLNPLYSGVAATTPAYVHSIISVLCINGTSRFVGGSSLFADKLREVVVDHGGEIFTSEGVCKINTREKDILSVTTVKGRTYAADYYISDIHPATLIQYLDDPKALPKAFRTRLKGIPNTYSAFTLNIKFKPETFHYIDNTAYYLERYSDQWHLGDPSSKGFLYMTPPEKNQGEFASKMIVTVPMAWNDVKQWEDSTLGHRPADYETWKKQYAEAVIDCIEKIHPDIRQCIDAVNTASPLTIRDYYGAKEGCMSGYLKDCNAITLSHIPVRTKIPNLLLTGQCVNLHGFCGVTLTAIKTSEAILGDNYILNKING